jgi:putative peptide zinc metalloprotease protein
MQAEKRAENPTGKPGNPRIRPDLVTSEVKQGGDVSYVVKDPVTQKFFRLKQHEYFIASRLDGRTSLEEIREAYRREFSAALPARSLENFIERMKALCLLEGGLGAREIAKQQRRASTESRVVNRLLQMRLRAVDPDRLLSAIAPHTRWLFTWQFVALTLVLTAVASALTAHRWDAYAAQIRTLMTPASIPTFVLVAVVVSGLHEVAHGLTCKHYGGEVHEIGFLLIYLVPALYCNVSDAWLFGDRAKRIWVSAAGTLFQVFLYGVAAIVWFFVSPTTWVSEACAMTIAIAGLTALFNFNPLIKLDGYYMLSDYLEIPNLRRRAFAHLGREARRLVRRGADGADGGAAPAGPTRRERAIYLTYGIVAGVYSVAFLAIVVFQIGGFLLSVFD